MMRLSKVIGRSTSRIPSPFAPCSTFAKSSISSQNLHENRLQVSHRTSYTNVRESFQQRLIFQRIFNAMTSKGSEKETNESEKEKEMKQVPGDQKVSSCGSGKGAIHSMASQLNSAIPSKRGPNPNAIIQLPNIGKIIVVASGKGGVGKSTVATNLALAIAQGGNGHQSLNKLIHSVNIPSNDSKDSSDHQNANLGNENKETSGDENNGLRRGLRVGVLDADVYGPSMHKMFNLPENSARVDPETGKLVPLSNYGVKVMSMGILTKSDEAAIWRGPMVMGAIRQMLTQVDWGHLDVLVIDLPPGTGDAQLTLTQQLRLDGAIIVSTPQDIALIDVVRGINMFQVVNVPIIGIVENMSYFQCSDCEKLGKKRYIFGHGGAKQKAQELNIPFLGEIPIQEHIPIACDQGKPVVITNRESIASKAFLDLADQVISFLSHDSAQPKTSIVFED